MLIAKTAFHKVMSPFMGIYTDVSTMVRTGLNSD